MSSAANPKQMTVRRSGDVLVHSPEGISTAPFWVQMLLESSIDGENTAIRAQLEPGTITRWHAHPRGQLLFVLAGSGLAQRENGPVETLHQGDAVWFAPGERHWHGATAEDSFSYISIQAVENGRSVDWFEHVE